MNLEKVFFEINYFDIFHNVKKPQKSFEYLFVSGIRLQQKPFSQLSDAAFGFYIRLVIGQALHPGPLPDADRFLTFIGITEFPSKLWDELVRFGLLKERERERESERERKGKERRGEERRDSSFLSSPSGVVNNKVKPPQFGVQDLFGLYKKKCTNLKGAAKLNNSRQKAASARLKEYPEEQRWHELAEFLNRSPWHTGSNDRKWKADFDFFVRPSTMLKFLEGSLAGQRDIKPQRYIIRPEDRKRMYENYMQRKKNEDTENNS